MSMQEHSSKIDLVSKKEKILKESTFQEKTLNIINNPEIIDKLKKKIDASPDKLKRMKNKWSKYENEQKLILTELNEEINKKRVSTKKQLLFYNILCSNFIMIFFFVHNKYVFCV